LRVFPALTEEGDDAIGQLAKGHRVEGRGVEPVDDERAVAADPFEVFAKVAPSAAAWAGFRVSAACSISSPTKVLLRSSGQPLLPAGDARDREPLPVGVLPDPDGATDEAGGFVSALRTSSARKAGSFSSGRELHVRAAMARKPPPAPGRARSVGRGS
jgi:hypothetical protein